MIRPRANLVAKLSNTPVGLTEEEKQQIAQKIEDVRQEGVENTNAAIAQGVANVNAGIGTIKGAINDLGFATTEPASFDSLATDISELPLELPDLPPIGVLSHGLEVSVTCLDASALADNKWGAEFRVLKCYVRNRKTGEVSRQSFTPVYWEALYGYTTMETAKFPGTIKYSGKIPLEENEGMVTDLKIKAGAVNIIDTFTASAFSFNGPTYRLGDTENVSWFWEVENQKDYDLNIAKDFELIGLEFEFTGAYGSPTFNGLITVNSFASENGYYLKSKRNRTKLIEETKEIKYGYSAADKFKLSWYAEGFTPPLTLEEPYIPSEEEIAEQERIHQEEILNQILRLQDELRCLRK